MGRYDDLDKLPTCMDYGNYLYEAKVKFGITVEEARKKYGQYTYQQWYDLLTFGKKN